MAADLFLIFSQLMFGFCRNWTFQIPAANLNQRRVFSTFSSSATTTISRTLGIFPP
jgi:hypothetical protein